MTNDQLKVGDRVRLNIDMAEVKDAIGTVMTYPHPINGGAEIFWDSNSPDLVHRGFSYCLPSFLKAA